MQRKLIFTEGESEEPILLTQEWIARWIQIAQRIHTNAHARGGTSKLEHYTLTLYPPNYNAPKIILTFLDPEVILVQTGWITCVSGTFSLMDEEDNRIFPLVEAIMDGKAKEYTVIRNGMWIDKGTYIEDINPKELLQPPDDRTIIAARQLPAWSKS